MPLSHPALFPWVKFATPIDAGLIAELFQTTTATFLPSRIPPTYSTSRVHLITPPLALIIRNQHRRRHPLAHLFDCRLARHTILTGVTQCTRVTSNLLLAGGANAIWCAR